MNDKPVYLQMIQSVISRMAGNSFLLKGWSVTLISALFALAAAGTNPLFVYLAYFPAFAFWSLDAYFLRQERLFRKLYEHAAALDASQIDYSMDTSSFNEQVDPQFQVAFSPTLRVFHGTTTGAIIVVMVAMLVAR